MINLTSEQNEIIESNEKIIRIIACPGSGKTFVLTKKIINDIINKNYEKDKILALTFTNFSTKKMINDIEKNDIFEVNILNYHKFALKIIYFAPKVTNYNFNEYTIQNDVKTVLKKIIRNHFADRDADFQKIKAAIYTAKSVFCDFHHNTIKLLNSYINNISKKIKKTDFDLIVSIFYDFLIYQYTYKIWEFDDLIFYCIRLLRDESFNLKISEKYKYIYVDEFQDTSEEEFKIIKLLTRNNKGYKLLVVGDPNQSIYEWRRARYDIFTKKFLSHFKNTKTYNLSYNFRSDEKIVDLSNNFIKNNLFYQNKLFYIANKAAKKMPNKKCRFYQINNIRKITSKIVTSIKKNIKKNPNEMTACLYRFSNVSVFLEKELVKSGVDYKIYKGRPFTQYKICQEIIHFINFLLFNEENSFKEVINVPSRKVGTVQKSKIYNYANKNELTFIDAFYKLAENNKINSESLVFLNKCKQFKDKYSKSSGEFYQFFINFLKEIKYIDYICNINKKSNNVSEIPFYVKDFLELLKSEDFSKENKEDTKELINMILCEVSNNNKNYLNNGVTLMTVHSAKGLEFDNVYLIYASLYNRNMSYMDDEEKRIIYVGITRAKNYLKFYSTEWNKNIRKSFIFNNKQFITKRDTLSEDDLIDKVIIHPYFGRGIIINLIDRKSKEYLEIVFKKFKDPQLISMEYFLKVCKIINDD